jgi:hypothetical protein
MRLLNFPITLPELREMFPDWAWLRSVNMFAYLEGEKLGSNLLRSQTIATVSSRQKSPLEPIPRGRVHTDIGQSGAAHGSRVCRIWTNRSKFRFICPS